MREIATNGEESSDFEYYLNLTPELTGKILSKGDWVEVLEPKQLREKIKEQTQAIAELYRKKRFWE